MNPSRPSSYLPAAVAPHWEPPPEIVPEYDPQSAGISPAQALAIVRSHWRTSLIIWIGISCVAAITLTFLPKTFVATATLIVETNNKDPLAGQEFPIGLLGSYVATQTELIQSPEVLAGVVARLDLIRDPEFAAGFRGSDTNSLRDYVERNLANALQVDQGRGGQLIYISAAAKEAPEAAIIANTVAEVYLGLQRRRINGPASERAQRYSEQLAELRTKVAAAQEKVAAFRQQHGITDVAPNVDPENVDTETQALNSLEEHLLDAQNQRRALEAKLAGGRGTNDQLEDSPQAQHLQEQLRSLQAQLAQLRATYGAQHPKVLEMKSEIASVEGSLKTELSSLTDNASGPLSRAQALEEKYARAVEEQRARVMKLREIQGVGAKLVLELESAQSVYKRALDGYDQIMFASAGNYTDVSFVSRATPPVRATKPRKLKLLLMAVMAGLGVGVGVPFASALLVDRRVRCSDDIERSFGIPVLAQFDPIPTTAGSP
jgi:uncharacterized protein involved in exopolysaccharide biosynthesis